MLDASGEVAGEDGLFRPSSEINAMKKMLGGGRRYSSCLVPGTVGRFGSWVADRELGFKGRSLLACCAGLVHVPM